MDFVSMLSVMRGINLSDVAYLYGQGLRNKTSHENRVRKWWFTFNALINPLKFLSYRTRYPQGSKIVFFWKSRNQQDSLQALVPSLQNYRLNVFQIDASSTGENKLGLSFWHILKFYLLFCCVQISRSNVFSVGSEDRIDIRLVVNSYFYFYASLVLLKDFKGMVMFANDHSTAPRAFFNGTTFLGLPTAYIQHAAVTEVFPPLTYDYAFLDGKDAVEKYDAIAKARGVVSTTRVYDFGNPKLDKFFQLRKFRTFKSSIRVGIAISLADRCELVASLIQKISQYPTEKIAIRLHPRLKLTSDQQCVLREAYVDVDIWSGSLFDFLEGIDVLIAGQSSVHLEAVASGVVTYCYDFGSKHSDYYGFVIQGVASRLMESTLQDVFCLANLKRNLKSQNDALRHYLSNDSYESGAADMIAKKVRDIIQSRSEAVGE